MGNQISVTKLFDAVTIEKSGTSLSKALGFNNSDGNFSLELHITGDGELKVEYQQSNSGEAYLLPEGGAVIKEGLTNKSGPGGDGVILIPFTAFAVAALMNILLTETGGSDSVTVSGWLAVQ
jgi:hypothetical protein